MKTTRPNTSRLLSFWNAAKWLLGVLFAGALTMGTAAFLMHRTGAVDLHHLTWFEYWVKLLTVPSVAFGLFVFLACAFVSTRKKVAGLLVVGLTLTLIGFGVYQHTLDDGFLETQYVVRYAGFLVGLVGGFAAAHHVFRGKRWATAH